MRVLVLGGNGFIGRNIVAKLQAKGAQVVIAGRYKTNENNSLQIKMQAMSNAIMWLPIVKNFDVIVNSVGILRERENEHYADIHTVAVESLAKACAQLGVKLIHISAIGLNATAKSQFITSKYWGEQAILASGAHAVIVRPSLLDGEGGYGAKWFRRVATWLVQFVMQDKGLIAPLQVTDLGEAVANLVVDNLKSPQLIELGGRDTLSIPQYLQALSASLGLKPALQITVPKVFVRIVSHLLDSLAWTPLSFGHFELMQGYNVPTVNWLPVLLGRKPSVLGVMLATQTNDDLNIFYKL